jgi:hypothetical protein
MSSPGPAEGVAGTSDSVGCTRARGSALLYLVGTAAFVPGGLLLHPELLREHDAIMFYIAGSSLLTVAAVSDLQSRQPGISRALHMALRFLLCAPLCFLAASIALWPAFKPTGTIVGRWTFRGGNICYLGASAALTAANGWRPALGASLYALAEIVFFVGSLLLHELGPLPAEGVICWVIAALLLVSGACVGAYGEFCAAAGPHPPAPAGPTSHDTIVD